MRLEEMTDEELKIVAMEKVKRTGLATGRARKAQDILYQRVRTCDPYGFPYYQGMPEDESY